MKISIVHATARISPPYPSFPRGWVDSCEAFANRADHPKDIEYVLSVHESNWDAFWNYAAQWLGNAVTLSAFGDVRVYLGAFGFERFTVVKNTKRNCVVDQCNAAAAQAKGGILMGSMDDLFPPEHWDTLILRAFEKGLPLAHDPGPAVLHVRTGSPSDDKLFVPQILTIQRFKQFGYMLHPDYESMFADNEFTEHAKRDGIVIDARHILFEHRHPAFGTAESDSVYEGENREQAYRRGQESLTRRRSQGFPTLQERPAGGNRPRITLCLPGEWFFSTWVCQLWSLHEYLMQHFDVNPPMFVFSSNVYHVRNVTAEAILKQDPAPDYVLWIDDDNLVTVNQFIRLFDDLVKNQDLDAVAAWCFCGTDVYDLPPVLSCGLLNERDTTEPFSVQEMYAAAEADELVSADYTGFPAVLMRTSLLKKIGPNPFTALLGPQYASGQSGEDVAFWARARKIGANLAISPRVKVDHLKLSPKEPKKLITAAEIDALSAQLEQERRKMREAVPV